MLITFSGIDGAGKSTQIVILKKNLAHQGIKVKHIWARGGYTKGFETLKKIIRLIFRNKLPESGISEKRIKIIAKPWIAKLWIRIAILDLILLWCVYVRVFKIMGFYILCDRYIEDTALDFKKNFSLIDVNKMFLSKKMFEETQINDSIPNKQTKTQKPITTNKQEENINIEIVTDKISIFNELDTQFCK